MRVVQRLAERPGVEAGLLGLLAAAVVAMVQLAGLLEPAELDAHDVFVRLHAGGGETPPVVVVPISEADIQRHGHPLRDDLLARALENLLAGGARAIGVDLYRDQPVPPGTAALQALGGRDPRLVFLEKFGEIGADGVPPPQWAPASRVGFSDFPIDRGGIVRRASLMLWSPEGRPHSAFSLQLVLAFLRPEGITIERDPDADDCIRLGAGRICALESTEGGYARLDARGFQYLLDYRAGPDAFPTLAFSEVLERAVPESLVGGRIVLLGATAVSTLDELYTPLSEGLLRQGRPLPGVAVHAHAVDQLLRLARGASTPIRGPGEALELSILLLAALGGAALARFTSSGVFFAIALPGIVLALVAACGLLLGLGWWVPAVSPSLGFLASAGLVTARVTFRERKEKSLIRDLFASTVGSKNVEELWQRRDQFMAREGALRSQLMTISVLMSDLKGFTMAAERLDHDLLMRWINDYMRAMATVIEANGGVVDDYAGDGIKADFGVPLPSSGEEIDRDAQNAVCAALAMGEEMTRLNDRWRNVGLPTGRMRIGINTGAAVVGPIGAGNRVKYTSIGSMVNTASRLESFDKEGFESEGEESSTRILISEFTLARLGGLFDTKFVGEAQLRGQERKIAIHRVLGRRSSA